MGNAPARSPRTERGTRTRETLLAAAREVFWRKGYADARVADIAEEAGMSHGTFYTYFDSKEAVLWAIASELEDGSYEAGSGTLAEADGDEVQAILLANRRYLEFHRTNRQALHLINEVAASNPKMNRIRLRSREENVRRVARSLRRMQGAGQCDPGLDSELAAQALVGMVSDFAAATAGKRMDLDAATATLTTLWARGIGLDVPWT